MSGYFQNDLQCCWQSIEALPPDGVRINLADGHCVDMDGAIRVAEFMFPNVALIETWSGSVEDTCYRKIGGKWFKCKYSNFRCGLIPMARKTDEGPLFWKFISTDHDLRARQVRVSKGPFKGKFGTVADIEGKRVFIAMLDGQRVWLAASKCELVD